MLWLPLHACLGAIEDVYLDLWDDIANVALAHEDFDLYQTLDAATRSEMEKTVLYVGACLRLAVMVGYAMTIIMNVL